MIVHEFAEILKHSRGSWIPKRSFFLIEYCQGTNVLIHTLKLGTLAEVASGDRVPIGEGKLLLKNKNGFQEQGTCKE
ncbi:UNVERIFIED_CONTAM: hypothetical protein K2H54_056164 [Gekko kuhli]